MEDELLIDPLYTLNSWRLMVSNSEEMKLIINRDRQTSKDEKEAEKKQALEFCEKYMMPYRPHVFEESMIEQMSI
jgi:hypothetical protein